jgi:hypothetical protein
MKSTTITISAMSLAIFSGGVGQPNPTTTDAAITSCDLEPISCESGPVKHHDTDVLLAWLVTVANREHRCLHRGR